MKKYRKILIIAVPIIAILIARFVWYSSFQKKYSLYTVHSGTFSSVVSSRGEVQGERSVKIEIPQEICDEDLRVWGLKIVDIIPEGKNVKKGDFIALLDQSDLQNNMREQMKQKETEDSDLQHAIIDSAVTLTGYREDIANALLDLEYQKIDLEQSKFESGAVQRKTKMQYQQAEIALEKKRRDYHLEQNRLKVRLSRVKQNVDRRDALIQKYMKALSLTRVVSPGDGIVMFANDWRGRKIRKDMQVSTWAPLIATLPDMSSAIVETYIKEIDITKVKQDDSVRIVVDALPGKEFAGKITQIANMGEDRKGFDMKVFKVIVRFNHTDPELKPGMTCNIEVVIKKFEDALIIPVEYVFTEDKQSFVYKRNGLQTTKQEVKLGASDEKNVVVLEGLSEKDKILTKKPETQAKKEEDKP